MNQLAAREDAQWMAVSLVPDVCLTPMGSSKVPVPYSAVAKLSDSTQTTSSVSANGSPLFVFDSSKTTQTMGDQAGVDKGIKSNTVGKDTWPKEKAQAVSAESHLLVRKNDMCWMNGNGPGSALEKKAVELVEIQLRIEAAKASGDSEQIAIAEDLKRQTQDLDALELARCVDDPSRELPTGWTRPSAAAEGVNNCFAPDSALVDMVSPGTLPYVIFIDPGSYQEFHHGTDLFPTTHILTPLTSPETELVKVIKRGVELPTISYEQRPKKEDPEQRWNREIEARKAKCLELKARLPKVSKPVIPLMGNTEGPLVVAPSPGKTASESNDVVKGENPQEIAWQDWLESGLDVAGCIPVLGIVPDAASCIFAFGRAIFDSKVGFWDKMADAGLSFMSAVPGLGWAVAGKFAKSAEKFKKVSQAASEVGKVVGTAKTISELPQTVGAVDNALANGDWESVVYNTINFGTSTTSTVNTGKHWGKQASSPPLLLESNGGSSSSSKPVKKQSKLGNGAKIFKRGNSQKLGNNLLKAKDKSGNPVYVERPENSAAHHIIAADAPESKPARDILDRCKIDINSAENGVFLSTMDKGGKNLVHRGRHSSEYMKDVNERIIKAYKGGGETAVRKELLKIRNRLSNPKPGATWQNVLK